MTTQLAPNSMSLPPPTSPELDLRDGDRVVGWIRGRAVGYRGFANETEAAGAAWVAHRTLSRRLARRHGGSAISIDVEPLSIARDGDHEAVFASNRPIATLLRPGVDSRSGPDSFGFEIQVPLPGGELAMRSIAYRIYRTLRKSGVRWAMWDKRRGTAVRRAAERVQPVPVPRRRPTKNSPSAIAFLSKFILSAIAIVIGAAAIVTAPRTVTIPIGIVVAAGLVASGLVATVERWHAARASRRVTPRPSITRDATDLGGGARPRRDRAFDEEIRTFGWPALGALSLAVLALAIVVPEELGIALAAIGFAGLFVFRLAAAWSGWLPRDPAHVEPRVLTRSSARDALRHGPLSRNPRSSSLVSS